MGAWRQYMTEDIVGYVVPFHDPFDLVEAPMDAEVDPALAVLFGGRAETMEGAEDQRPYFASGIQRSAVHFIGADGERDVVRTVEVGERPKQCSAEACMA